MRIFQGHSALANEAIGTFLFVLIGTSAITAINITGQATTSAVMLVGSLAFAISLGWLVYVLRRTGLVHLNPVTTLYFLIQGKTSVVQALTYIVSQLFGAISASVVVALLYGTAGVESRLGAPYPSTAMGEWAAVGAEFVGTLILLATIRTAITRPQLSNAHQSLLIGIGFGLGYLVSVGVSGGSLNPARALAPQLTAADLTSWWVYVSGPLFAVIVGSLIFRSASSEQNVEQQVSPMPTDYRTVESDYDDEESGTSPDQSSKEIEYSDEDAELQRKAQQAIASLNSSKQQPQLPSSDIKPSFYPEDEGDEDDEPVISSEPEKHVEESQSDNTSPVKFMKYERSGDDNGQ